MLENSFEVSLTPDAMSKFGPDIANQMIVMVNRPIVAKTAEIVVIGMPGFPKDVRVDIAPDGGAKKLTNAFAFSS